MKKEPWQELDEKALMAIHFCLPDEVLDEFSIIKKSSILIVGATSVPPSEEVVSELVDSEAASLSSPHA